jgi:glycosyltransferase involved in cell wall biosynthesis
MAVNVAEYDRAREHSTHNGNATGPLVIGWAGTPGGLAYLHKLAPVLRELTIQHDITVRVISGGYQRVCLPGVRVRAQAWKPATGLADMAQFDIGIVPLDDTPFEQAKFPFKLLQYLALGLPAVSARVGTAATVIQDGENGLLVDSAATWRDALERLITDADLRTRLGQAGRETVHQRYTLERVGPLLATGLRCAARSKGSSTANTAGKPY